MIYRVDVDDFNKEEWEVMANGFADYSIYQTWAYQQVRATMDNQTLIHVLVKDDNNDVCLMCLVRVRQIKPIGFKIGYVQWGPLVRRKNGVPCSSDMLQCFKDYLLGGPVDVLRIVPNAYNDCEGKLINDILVQAGFIKVKSIEPYRTMLLSLDKQEDELRNAFHRSWRRYLNKASKQNLEIREGTELELFKVLESLYNESRDRKGFTGLDPKVFIRAQELLPSMEKMNVIVAYLNGTPVTAHITSNLGEIAQGILAATSTEGLSVWSSYIVWWETLLLSKRKGLLKYDLGGIDPVNNPNVHTFKARMGSEEAFHIGSFDVYTNNRSRLAFYVIEKIYGYIKKQ